MLILVMYIGGGGVEGKSDIFNHVNCTTFLYKDSMSVQQWSSIYLTLIYASYSRSISLIKHLCLPFLIFSTFKKTFPVFNKIIIFDN